MFTQEKRMAMPEWHSLYDFAFLDRNGVWIALILYKGYDNDMPDMVWCKRHGWEHFE